jgi:hypothetical protein
MCVMVIHLNGEGILCFYYNGTQLFVKFYFQYFQCYYWRFFVVLQGVPKT